MTESRSALRCLPEGHLAATRDLFNLGEFLPVDALRRNRYFTAVDSIIHAYRAVLGVAPPDLSLRAALAYAVSLDPDFRTFVARDGEIAAVEALTKPDDWDRIVVAGAGTILTQYFDALENGSWR